MQHIFFDGQIGAIKYLHSLKKTAQPAQSQKTLQIQQNDPLGTGTMIQKQMKRFNSTANFSSHMEQGGKFRWKRKHIKKAGNDIKNNHVSHER